MKFHKPWEPVPWERGGGLPPPRRWDRVERPVIPPREPYYGVQPFPGVLRNSHYIETGLLLAYTDIEGHRVQPRPTRELVADHRMSAVNDWAGESRGRPATLRVRPEGPGWSESYEFHARIHLNREQMVSWLLEATMPTAERWNADRWTEVGRYLVYRISGQESTPILMLRRVEREWYLIPLDGFWEWWEGA